MQRARMVMVLVVVVFASCSKQREPAPSKPAPPAPAVDAAAVASAREEPICLLVTVTPTNVMYKGGGKAGELPRTPGKLDLAPLRVSSTATRRSCAAKATSRTKMSST